MKPTQVVSVCADTGEVRAEWMKIPAVVKAFGIGRTVLYELIAEGKVKSVSLKKRGGIRGIRLVNADSVRAMLEAEATAASN